MIDLANICGWVGFFALYFAVCLWVWQLLRPSDKPVYFIDGIDIEEDWEC